MSNSDMVMRVLHQLREDEEYKTLTDEIDAFMVGMTPMEKRDFFARTTDFPSTYKDYGAKGLLESIIIALKEAFNRSCAMIRIQYPPKQPAQLHLFSNMV